MIGKGDEPKQQGNDFIKKWEPEAVTAFFLKFLMPAPRIDNRGAINQNRFRDFFQEIEIIGNVRILLKGDNMALKGLFLKTTT
jgi:hypothetical protein